MPFFPTLHPKPSFDEREAETIATAIKTAMKGIGTDEKRIIKEMTSLTNQQRQIVKERYQTMYGNTLEEDLKSELKGEFEDIIVALLKPRYDYEAECIRKAISGVGTRENVIIELLCTKESAEIEKLKVAYKRIQSIKNRPAYFARQLYKSMEGVGTREHDLMRIIVTRCEVDMVDIKREFKTLYKKSLYDEIKRELSGDFEEVVLKLVGKD